MGLSSLMQCGSLGLLSQVDGIATILADHFFENSNPFIKLWARQVGSFRGRPAGRGLRRII
jgi:hypothetical protein